MMRCIRKRRDLLFHAKLIVFINGMIHKVFNYQRHIRRQIYALITTVISRALVYLSGAVLGKGVTFYGRPFVLKSASGFLKIGDNCTFRSNATSNLIGINRPCIISVQSNAVLNIGAGCGFSGTVIGCFLSITLEDNVRCGANTLITDSDWHLDDPRSGEPKSIYIEKNVWLGVNVTVMKGVRIGENSVIGAGSVVTKDVPANVVAAGNPCLVIKQLA